MPKVSVIVTTYNRKEYLTETINSILNQTFQDFELIVVDNYSNYDFYALIASFNSVKTMPLQNQNNGIIAINRNIGVMNAKGEYIAFCDDDDIWINNKLELQIKKINETNCDLVYSNMTLFKGDVANIIKNTSNKKIDSLKDLINQNSINTSSVLVRNENLFFPEDPNLIAVEDYALWLNLYLRGFRFECMPQVLVYFRISEMNTSAQMWAKKHLKLIYLFTALLINNQSLPIKLQVLRVIIFNYLKYLIKNVLK